jgi:hypothetical protein
VIARANCAGQFPRALFLSLAQGRKDMVEDSQIVGKKSTPDITDNRPISIELAHLKDQRHESYVAPWKPDRITTTSFYPFDINLKPISASPGWHDLNLKVQCPICNKQIELKCRQESVLFTRPSDFKSDQGKILKRLLFYHITFLWGWWLLLMWVGFSIISVIPSVLLLVFVIRVSAPMSMATFFITVFSFGLFLLVILQSYKCFMLGRRDSLVIIRKSRQFRPEFHNAFNIFTKVSVTGAPGLPQVYASEHFMVNPEIKLLACYGFSRCKVFG